MTPYISILRGINVSGQNIIKMPDLVEIYKELGFIGVQTYIQSGNVIFQADDNDLIHELAKKIENAILRKFNINVPVIIRTRDEIKAILDANPFITNVSQLTKKLYITFLEEIPLSADIEKINTFNFLPDKFSIHGREIYLECAGGYGTTKLSNAFFEAKLKVKATTRNWNTINKLYGLAQTL